MGHPVSSTATNFSYSPSAITVSNGVAQIQAQETNGNWTSGILSMNGLHQYEYGYFQVTAKLPAGQGFWPALWLYGSNSSGDELDMLESVGGGNTVYQTVHDSSGAQAYQDQATSSSFTTSYNTYGMLWTSTGITFYINGVKTGSCNVAINEPMYMMLCLDVAGPNDWGGPPMRQLRQKQILISALSRFISRVEELRWQRGAGERAAIS